MPSTPLVHNHGGTGEQEAVTAGTQDRPPAYTCVTTINSRKVGVTAAERQTADVQLLGKKAESIT